MEHSPRSHMYTLVIFNSERLNIQQLRGGCSLFYNPCLQLYGYFCFYSNYFRCYLCIMGITTTSMYLYVHWNIKYLHLKVFDIIFLAVLLSQIVLSMSIIRLRVSLTDTSHQEKVGTQVILISLCQMSWAMFEWEKSTWLCMDAPKVNPVAQF
jgi:hypothetical protein